MNSNGIIMRKHKMDNITYEIWAFLPLEKRTCFLYSGKVFHEFGLKKNKPEKNKNQKGLWWWHMWANVMSLTIFKCLYPYFYHLSMTSTIHVYVCVLSFQPCVLRKPMCWFPYTYTYYASNFLLLFVVEKGCWWRWWIRTVVR